MDSTDASEKGRRFYAKDIGEIYLELEGKTDTTSSELVFRGCRLESKDDWKNLKPKVQKIPTLKLDYTDLKGKVQGLVDFLQRFQVQSLSLINTHLQTEDIQKFYEELKECETGKVRLHSMNFKFLELETSGCEIIAKIVNLLPDVEELVLTNTYFDDEAIEKFLSTVDDRKAIKKLLLSENDGFTAEGMLNIGRLAKKCQVQEMELASCYLTDDHIEKLLTTLPENVQSVNLLDNPQLSAKSVKFLLIECEALQKRDHLGHSFDNEQWNKLLPMFLKRKAQDQKGGRGNYRSQSQIITDEKTIRNRNASKGNHSEAEKHQTEPTYLRYQLEKEQKVPITADKKSKKHLLRERNNKRCIPLWRRPKTSQQTCTEECVA